MADYMELVNRIRDNRIKGMKVRDAIDEAVDSYISDGIMEDFLVKHKAEGAPVRRLKLVGLTVSAKAVRRKQSLDNGVRLTDCQESDCFIVVMKHMKVCGAKRATN